MFVKTFRTLLICIFLLLEYLADRGGARGYNTRYWDLWFDCRYIHDDEELRKYFAAFHVQRVSPRAVIIDDFYDLFNERWVNLLVANWNQNLSHYEKKLVLPMFTRRNITGPVPNKVDLYALENQQWWRHLLSVMMPSILPSRFECTTSDWSISGVRMLLGFQPRFCRIIFMLRASSLPS
jgi:hypothetical protein